VLGRPGPDPPKPRPDRDEASSDTTQLQVVVGVDGSPASDAAVRWAAGEAAMRALRMKLIHVVAPTRGNTTMAPNGTVAQWQEDHARQIVEQSRRVVDGLPVRKRLEVGVQLAYAHVVPALLDASMHAYMIVVGARGPDAEVRHPLGSVTWALIRHAHCPVAVVHDPQAAQGETREAPVLVGIDGSASSEAATALAFDEASRRGVGVVALHAWTNVGVFPILGMGWRDYRHEGDELLTQRLAGWQERYPDVRVDRRLVCDVPARWLVEESKNAQLVVLGSHGRGHSPGKHLGSVTSAVAQSSCVPVIVFRSGGS
jgi:nucleotide-binding universal stress UspA family protein